MYDLRVFDERMIDLIDENDELESYN